uniref:IF rod domain-containing protein n=1 Tax=Knipowitschia caucasica TaxID=637954 RepID=A0AAV2JYH3_KNICA
MSNALLLVQMSNLPVGLASGLSWSLVDYRDKVQALEQLNLELEQRLRAELQQRVHSATSWGPLKAEWDNVYRQVSEWILSNARLMLETENVQNNAEDFKDRFDCEFPWRQQLQDDISALLKVTEDAAQARLELQQRNDELWAELQALQLNHKEVRAELQVRAGLKRAGLQVRPRLKRVGLQVRAGLKRVGLQNVRALYPQHLEQPDLDQTDLDQILDHIRTQWERVCEQNRVQSQCPESKVSGLSPQQEQMEHLKSEVQDSVSKVQSLQAQTESLRALKRALENSLSDTRSFHEVEVQNISSLVSRLEAELKEVRGDAEAQRRDLDLLLSNKERLEEEVLLYQSLLEDKEVREEVNRDVLKKKKEVREEEYQALPQEKEVYQGLLEDKVAVSVVPPSVHSTNK